MKKGRGLALLLAGAILPALSGCLLPPDAPSVLASAGGTGPDDAYVVYSVEQEYEVLRLLGLRPERQSLHIIDGRAFDVIIATNPETGEARDVWFDISRFFGRL
ncbi:hypothetical protein M3P36_06090 [Altererythrobacter sp. KTW20L]|uniref:hypothetical protein n=1 Tax=Altererythrobacter sp. KTW20L TaxID=2942210 RepID=UPI0020BDDF7A|nr:hypothetical protein [Altererythrobacter sp. KTW20L]MCL6250613.1 hypothetical protein [Altererythrobacter sp. KTW20L]